MSWLLEYARTAARSDQLCGAPNHAALLAAGLMGEAGSVLAELKKAQRERDAYPGYRYRLIEEVGDFMWYFIRLASLTQNRVIARLARLPSGRIKSGRSALSISLEFASRVSEVTSFVQCGTGPAPEGLDYALERVWLSLMALCKAVGVSLRDAAKRNLKKIWSRWSTDPKYHKLFDDDFPPNEQLPRKLKVEFFEQKRNSVIARCDGKEFGDKITDNIKHADDYRFHDIFHFAYAVHLGWSPVMRALLKRKRKSIRKIDEAEDGARAWILEEAIAATVFAKAKELKFFRGLDHVEYDLLKDIQIFIRGYEVGQVPLWQWERAILDGYRVFRELRRHRGGTVILDLRRHTLTYAPRGNVAVTPGVSRRCPTTLGLNRLGKRHLSSLHGHSEAPPQSQ